MIVDSVVILFAVFRRRKSTNILQTKDHMFYDIDMFSPGAPSTTVTDVMCEGLQLDAKLEKLFRKIAEGSLIERRYSVLPKIDGIYFGCKGIGMYCYILLALFLLPAAAVLAQPFDSSSMGLGQGQGKSLFSSGGSGFGVGNSFASPLFAG